MISYIRKSVNSLKGHKLMAQCIFPMPSHNSNIQHSSSTESSFTCNLSLKLTQPFTIKNYMKTYAVEDVDRSQPHTKHSIFRVDEHKSFASNKPLLQQFISQQTAHYQTTRKAWQGRTKKYYQQCSERRDTRTSSAQQQYDHYSYFTSVKYIEDKEYTVIHRRHNTTLKEQVVLDIMHYPSLKKHYKTIELMRTAFSDSHRYVAFGYDLNNNEYVRWMVKDTKGSRIVGVKGWQANVLEDAGEVLFYQDKALFYTKTQNRRPSQLYYQEFDGQPQLILQEKDPSCWLYIELSKDKSHLIISSTSKASTHVHCLKLPQDPSFTFTSSTSPHYLTSIAPSSPTQKLQVNHCEDYMVIWRQNQVKSTISIKKDGEKQQKVIHTLDPEQTLTDKDIFDDSIVLYIQRNTKPIIRIIHTHQNFTIEQPPLPYPIGKVSPGMNQLYRTHSFFFYISTPFVYNEGYTYDIEKKTFQLTQKFQTTGPKFNHKKYQTTTIQIPALDGEMIPLTILSQKRTTQYPKKLILKVYGFYGLPNEVSYCNMNYPLLQNGWTIVYAHVRGGGDKGKQWHAKALRDKNIIWSDLEDSVAYLLREKYTHPSLLCMESHSAGAIAIWNMINKSPHLFKAAVLKYPFLDVLNSLIDPNDPLAASDHAEFGNPLISKRAFREIESISPYDNIQEKPYPFIYMVGGQNDYRCPVEQLAKFVRRYRQLAWVNNRYSEKIAEKGILLKVHDDASHLGTSDIGQQNYNNCQVYGFLDYLIYEASSDCKY